MPPLVRRTIPRAPTPSQRPPSVIDRIKPIGFEEDHGIQILLYGRSGTGKTTLWSTFPGKILAIICSGGLQAGELRSVDTPENRDKIRQVVLENSGEIRDIVAYAADPANEFKTIVLDHASGLQDLVLKEILGLTQLPAQMSWGLATQQQYGQCTLQCKELLRALLGLKANIVIVAQEREFGGGEGQELIKPTVGAGLTPSLTGWLNTAVDYIGQTYIRGKVEMRKQKALGREVEQAVRVKGVDYVLRALPDEVYTTKFRMPKGRQIDDIVDPTYDKIISLIRG
jgi:hypothetical protein